MGISVHFKGFTSKWDLKINLSEPEGLQRVMPVGSFSKGYGWAKYDTNF
jgi:hypothetical protein